MVLGGTTTKDENGAAAAYTRPDRPRRRAGSDDMHCRSPPELLFQNHAKRSPLARRRRAGAAGYFGFGLLPARASRGCLGPDDCTPSRIAVELEGCVPTVAI